MAAERMARILGGKGTVLMVAYLDLLGEWRAMRRRVFRSAGSRTGLPKNRRRGRSTTLRRISRRALARA
jgi:hypothetical protein